MSLFIQLMARAMLGVLAGDILYLYYAGGWTDITIIRYTELVILWALIPLSIT